jgi:hypothetical protein
MYLHHRPCRRVKMVHAASPNAAWPGLHRKPLHAAIRQLFALYCPGGCEGDSNKASIKNIPTLLALLMVMTLRRYCTVHIARWRRPMAFLKATKRRDWVSTCSDYMNQMCPPQFIVVQSKMLFYLNTILCLNILL